MRWWAMKPAWTGSRALRTGHGQTEHAAAFNTVAGRSVAPGDARLASLVGQIATVERADALMAGFGL
jgi:hypothetical protein